MRNSFLALFFLINYISYSQEVDFYGKKIDTRKICNSLGFTDNKEAKLYLDTICNSIGIKNNFIMAPCNSVGTCLATEINGDYYILYDNNFFAEIKKTTLGFTEKKIKSKTDKYNWQYLTILAHELGHFQNNHFSPIVRKTFSNNDLELQADEYAGYVINKLGGTLEQGKFIFNSNFVSLNKTLEHPARKDRIEAFEKGYNKQTNSNFINAENLIEQNTQLPAQFPGGNSSWQTYLSNNLQSDIAFKKGAPVGRYTIVASFTISENGKLTDIKTENDPGFGTKEEMIRVLSNSPDWIPAVQNGRNIKYSLKQIITFIVSEK